MSFGRHKDWKESHRERHHIERKPHEHADGTFSVKPEYDIPDAYLGLILPPKEEQYMMGTVSEVPFGLVEPPVIISETVKSGYANVPLGFKHENQTLGAWYSQVGGTCGGYSGAQGGTETFSNYPNEVMVFSGMDMYRACREAGSADPDNINAGIQMGWLAKALTMEGGGRSRRLNGAWQPRSLQYGAQSTYRAGNDKEIRKVLYNNWLTYTGQATTPRMSVHIGIPIYDAFLSPKTINGVSWVYWQTGPWGGLRGGHALLVADWSDLIKLVTTSRGSMLLPNTWADSGFPQSRISAEALMECLAADGELIISIAKTQGPPPPMGKLELAEPFILIPPAPKVGDKIKVHFAVKNTGNAPLTNVKLAVEDMVDSVGGPGFGYEGPFDLNAGDVHSYEPERPEAVTAGHWRFRGDSMYPTPVVLTGAVIEVDVSNTPPPPLPPVASFTATPLSGAAPLTVLFTDTSSGNPTSWHWDFGDETAINAKNPSHTYLEAGIYTVSLTVTNSVNSNTMIEKDMIVVTEAPPTPVEEDFSMTLGDDIWVGKVHKV